MPARPACSVPDAARSRHSEFAGPRLQERRNWRGHENNHWHSQTPHLSGFDQARPSFPRSFGPVLELSHISPGRRHGRGAGREDG